MSSAKVDIRRICTLFADCVELNYQHLSCMYNYFSVCLDILQTRHFMKFYTYLGFTKDTDGNH